MKKQSSGSDLSVSPALRRFLYFTAATTGAAILIVEILGAKMLSPYIGTSHFVWTAQIAVTLVSLAIGYYFGGWLVDRSPKLGKLYSCILFAGVYLCITVLVVEQVAYACLRFQLAMGALLASMFLFFVPLTLLAAVVPFVIRFITETVAEVGGQVGRLSAISTFGSVLGTVLIGYVLIPRLPNSVSMAATAGVLIAVVLVYFSVWGRRSKNRLGVVILALAGAIGAAGGIIREQRRTFQNAEELYHNNSNFGMLQVLKDTPEIRTPEGNLTNINRLLFLNDYLTQNTYDVDRKQSLSMFTYMLYLFARGYSLEIKDALCIGLGIGLVPSQLARDGAAVDVIEINPAVPPMAQRYFDFDPARVNLIIGDGRYFLNRCQKKYDAVVLDAFLGDSSPSHLMSQEALGEIHRILRPRGVLVVNFFGSFEAGRDFFSGSLYKTALQAGFKTVRIHAGRYGNTFLVASESKELNLERPADLSSVHFAVRHLVEDGFTEVAPSTFQAGQVLTDDFNPVEFYDAGNRERIRRRLAFTMREF